MTTKIEEVKEALLQYARLAAMEKRGVDAKALIEAYLLLAPHESPAAKPAGLDSGIALEMRSRRVESTYGEPSIFDRIGDEMIERATRGEIASTARVHPVDFQHAVGSTGAKVTHEGRELFATLLTMAGRCKVFSDADVVRGRVSWEAT